MKGLHGIVFSYEKAPGLRELIEHRMPASVPFGGRWRVIDFTLSNLRSAGVTDVGVVLHGNYQSLLDHLGSGKVWDMSRKNGGLKLLPPFANAAGYRAETFRGKMEALAGVRSYLEQIRQDHVILCDSDLIVNLPIADVLEAHLASDADITVVCTAESEYVENATYLTLDGDGRVNAVRCAPRTAEGHRSLEMYILSRALLLQLVDECAAQDKISFRHDVLQAKAEKLNIRGWVWDGYAAQLRSVQEYYERSMQLLRPSIRSELFCPTRPILAKEDDEASSYFAPESQVRASLVADGCIVEGLVENSILFPGVTVARGAQVRNCVLMKNTRVGENANLRCVITDKNVSILPDRTLIGHESYPMVISRGSEI